ncbi:hypothetical protein ACFL0I_00195 [Gemmatimonadota bacterium]
MGRRKIRAGDVEAFLEELRASGVEEFEVRPAPVEDWVVVWWDDPGAPTTSGEDAPGKLFRWSLILILLGLTLAIYLLGIIMGGILESHGGFG